MQEKLVALAVAGLVSGGAFAQSNVSIYGIVDVGYMNQNFDGADKRVSSIDSGLLSPSRIGFKGEEALGNGLKAVFNLEYALAIDGHSGIGEARQQNVGLSHSTYGTILAGYLQTAGYDFAVAASPLATAQFGTANALGINGMLSTSGIQENAVAYVSPTVAGFNIALNHGRITESANTNIGRAGEAQVDAYVNILGVSYVNGPITAGFAYAKMSLKDKGGDVSAFAGVPGPLYFSTDGEEYGLRGGYDFGFAKLQAAYQTIDAKDLDYGRDSTWVIGTTIPVSAAGKVVAEYGRLNVKTPEVAKTEHGLYYPGYADARAWTLAYTHALSKRTTAYAGYNQVSSDVADLKDEGDVKRVAFGLRHAF
ncbi:porin [Rhodocyclus purpureus]|uniref:porin n=1 Tax=Rhodocyclus purpureus TaxID=1067 RepID=UPI0019132AB6|nr:porin [Rhodocyclus purpureus]MBK5912734.1 hypothetical protein [Rhodocyclus purpureus]